MLRSSAIGYNLTHRAAFGALRRTLPGGLPEVARPLLDEALFGRVRAGYYPRWPASLPVPLVSGAGGKRAPNTVRTDMSAGMPRSRRTATAQLLTLTLKWRLSPLEFAVFEGFFVHELFDGARWFLIALDTPRGWQEVTARFSSLFDYTLLTGLNKEVSAQLEVRDWPVMDRNTLAGYL